MGARREKTDERTNKGGGGKDKEVELDYETFAIRTNSGMINLE